MIMENLRFMLQDYNTSDPLWFGCQYQYDWGGLKNGYPQGGAGYILSKGALEKLVNQVSGERIGSRHTSDFHKPYCHKKIKRHYHKEIKRHFSCNIIFSPCELKICFWGQNMLVLKCNSNILTKKCRFIFLSKYRSSKLLV
jgi:hypothetical protein